jgi:hypothetical protein
MEPDAPLTRGEAARILWKRLRTARPDLPEERFQGLAFTDVVFGHPYAVPVQNLFLLGVIERTENRRFNPDEPIKRRDFVRWLTRALAIVEPNEWQPLQGQRSPFVDVRDDDPDLPFLAICTRVASRPRFGTASRRSRPTACASNLTRPSAAPTPPTRCTYSADGRFPERGIIQQSWRAVNLPTSLRSCWSRTMSIARGYSGR